MRRLLANALCLVLVAGAPEHYPRWETPDGKLLEVNRQERRISDHPIQLAVLIGVGVFIAYELFSQSVICPLPDEGTKRLIPQWVERAEHPLLYWWMLIFHAALAASLSWRLLAV
jgi:hypothetical protein